MSTRDRFLSQLSAAQDQLHTHLDSFQRQHFPELQRNQEDTSGDPAARSRATEHNERNPLPTYAPDQAPDEPDIPPAVLSAQPGRAQEVYDSMPRSRLENTTAPDRERRRAAEEMRRGQDMLHKNETLTAEQRAAGFKRLHSYTAGNGKVVLDIHTLPQRSPTFMGGSAERGRGSLQGQVIVFAQDHDKIGAIRLKIKAVSRISLPRSAIPPSAQPHRRPQEAKTSGPVVLAGRSPKSEPTIPREQLILQLEKTLWSTESSDTSMILPPTNEGSPNNRVWKSGKHAFNFKVELPATGKDGKELPPSFVYLADKSDAVPPSAAARQAQVAGALSTAKRWVEQAGNITNDGEWASVKWYIKVTVERPGFFKSNERIFAPFVYLPPPPRKLQQAVLPRRLKMNHQLSQNPMTPGNMLAEPMEQWNVVPLDLEGGNIESGKGQGRTRAKLRRTSSVSESKDAVRARGGMWSRLFKGPVLAAGIEGKGARWTLRMPNQPSIWPLKSLLPFELRVDGGSGGLRPPIMGLYMRITLVSPSKGLLSSKSSPQSATETKQLAMARLFGGTDARSSSGAGGIAQVWRGIIEFPPHATPDFESPLIETEYFVGLQKEPGTRLIWAQKILLVCSMPVVVKAGRKTPVASQGSTTNGHRVSNVESRASSGIIRASVQPAQPSRIPVTLPSATPASSASNKISSSEVRRSDGARRLSSSPSVPSSAPGPSNAHRNNQTRLPSRTSSPLPPSTSADLPEVRSKASGSRRPADRPRQESVVSSTVPSAASSAVGMVSSSSYPAEKMVPADSAAAQPTSSRRARREHERSESAAHRDNGRGEVSIASSRRSSRAPSETSAQDRVDWDFQDRGDGSATGEEGLEEMGMDMPPSYWEATAELRDDQ